MHSARPDGDFAVIPRGRRRGCLHDGSDTCAVLISFVRNLYRGGKQIVAKRAAYGQTDTVRPVVRDCYLCRASRFPDVAPACPVGCCRYQAFFHGILSDYRVACLHDGGRPPHRLDGYGRFGCA